jgi:integrase
VLHRALRTSASERLRGRVVSKRLSHATVSISLDTYSHAVPALEEAAAVIAGSVFAG